MLEVLNLLQPLCCLGLGQVRLGEVLAALTLDLIALGCFLNHASPLMGPNRVVLEPQPYQA